ncbi:MAG: transposase [Thermoplasmataceae archaeon]
MDYDNGRKKKGKEIAKSGKLKQEGNHWIVPSQSGHGNYVVSLATKEPVCTCPDFENRHVKCKHIIAVEISMTQSVDAQGNVTITQTKRITYSQDWSAYNTAQNKEVKLFDSMLCDLVASVEEPVQTRGRPRLNLSDELFCAIQKVYSQLSSRRSASLFEFAESRHQISHKPHFNVSSKVLNREEIAPILENLLSITALPLKTIETKFATDSSGFRTRNFMQYAEQKYNLKREHGWLKAHITIGVKTNIITALKVTENSGADTADSPQFKPLMNKTHELGFTVEEASADKAYSSRDNLALIDKLGGVPYIPFKSNTTGKPRGNNHIWRKMYAMFMLRKEEFEEHYHLRSNVETTFSAWKMKLGDSLKSKNLVAQKNELFCKAIAYNITVLIHEMFELGIKPDFIPNLMIAVS